MIYPKTLYRVTLAVLLIFASTNGHAQAKWENVDAQFQPLPPTVHVYKSTTPIDGKPSIAYYVSAELSDRQLEFTTDTTQHRRFTPQQYYRRQLDSLQPPPATVPLVIINTSFFSYETNQNLNIVVRDGKLLGYNIHTLNGRGKDTFTYRHPFTGAFGITKKRKAAIGWALTDSAKRIPYLSEKAIPALRDSIRTPSFRYLENIPSKTGVATTFKKWKVTTAVGGGPVLLQNGEIKVSNEEEIKFTGKGLQDKHPRSAIGYTADGKLILLAVEGRHPGTAEGASLVQLAQLFKDIGAVEALNLDGGGSSCLLVNGKPTITMSDAVGQRPVPGVFMILQRN